MTDIDIARRLAKTKGIYDVRPAPSWHGKMVFSRVPAPGTDYSGCIGIPYVIFVENHKARFSGYWESIEYQSFWADIERSRKFAREHDYVDVEPMPEWHDKNVFKTVFAIVSGFFLPERLIIIENQDPRFMTEKETAEYTKYCDSLEKSE